MARVTRADIERYPNRLVQVAIVKEPHRPHVVTVQAFQDGEHTDGVRLDEWAAVDRFVRQQFGVESRSPGKALLGATD